MKNMKGTFAGIVQKIKSVVGEIWFKILIGLAYLIWGLGLAIVVPALILYLIESMVFKITNGIFSVLFSRACLFSIYIQTEYITRIDKEGGDVVDDYFEENRLMIDVLKMMSEGRL